jgi:cation diffusion facilitator family transporter
MGTGSTVDPARWRHSHSFGQDVKHQGERRTMVVIILTASMMVIEIAGGLIFGSMALLADGIHMGSHAVALGINAFAYIYARTNAKDPRFSFGTGKVNALGGFSGAVLLAFFALMMAYESVERLFFPTHIAFNWAIGVAVVGLIVNGASVFILGIQDHDHGHSRDDKDHAHHGHGAYGEDHHEHRHHHDHNLRSAYLHVLADALTSVTAIFALLTAKYLGWMWVDPLMGIVGSLLVTKWSIGLLKQSSAVLLDKQAPEHIVAAVRRVLAKQPAELTDLHVWSLAPGKFGVIAALASDTLISADDIRRLLDPNRFPHVTVEVNWAPVLIKLPTERAASIKQ